ncbi:ComEA family DNA-binding protein [Campylobacter sp. US33a]|uniref:ComEA family DNA-binding protein n=1 Tax=Campylobacter sp. CCS1377 TaxID=3158229 RepID=A0AAU7E7R4_9BACT|nr:ComEA family DNA-binding protein [Campylobacter sp. US33a]MCW1361043.1 ComEA family DNA-binding protein [Campylobacter jejuni]TEY01978.1 ComEA family DNA-binding protein [Campylobacter sp. US33a]
MRKIFFLLFCMVGFVFAAININTATLEELKTLKGIGDAKAKAILEYRKDQNFTSIEDIKKINGIGDKIFEGIKNDIVVE